MTDIKLRCRELAAEALQKLGAVGPLSACDIPLETPPDPSFGDAGIPMFMFAKTLRQSPVRIAEQAVQILNETAATQEIGSFSASGPYVNIKFNRAAAARSLLDQILSQADSYGSSINDQRALEGKRVMIEFSSPNTNKPLHLGHLRNNALGESISRILHMAGAQVYKVNIINDRGVHICKSMLAYTLFHEGEDPESLHVKSDRFVGDCYVEFDKYRKEHPEAEAEAQSLLVRWEEGDEKVRSLWKKMNSWAISGIQQTYKRTGISFDKLYFESDTYLKGRDEVLGGLERGLFYREDDGSVWVDLSEIGLDKKVLLRKDGTALYMTQDIGTAIYRRTDWEFNELVYVVGNEQQYHFKVLFYVLKKLGYDWAEHLFHLSYGMVNLPEGRMKSREGTVVDADDLLDSLRSSALEEISAKGREEAVGDPAAVAEKIALAALHYYLLHISPEKDMLFNPKESLSFTGDTGPYVQYMGARICSILERADSEGKRAADPERAAPLLSGDHEWELIKLLGDFPSVTLKSAEALDPAVLAGYTYELCKSFSRFYHDCPILSAQSAALIEARLCLTGAVLIVLKNAMDLILIPFLETM